MTDIKKILRKINGYTQSNNHTESVLVLARFLEDKTAIEELTAIQQKADRVGYMEPVWMKQRYTILTNLLNKVTFKYSEALKDEFNCRF
jgi:hypothetical protein